MSENTHLNSFRAIRDEGVEPTSNTPNGEGQGTKAPKAYGAGFPGFVGRPIRTTTEQSNGRNLNSTVTYGGSQSTDFSAQTGLHQSSWNPNFQNQSTSSATRNVSGRVTLVQQPTLSSHPEREQTFPNGQTATNRFQTSDFDSSQRLSPPGGPANPSIPQQPASNTTSTGFPNTVNSAVPPREQPVNPPGLHPLGNVGNSNFSDSLKPPIRPDALATEQNRDFSGSSVPAMSPRNLPYPRPGQNSSTSSSGVQGNQAKLNPALMPRPSQMEKPCGTSREIYKTLRTVVETEGDTGKAPPNVVPSSVSDFIALDTGSASPRFGRLTLSCLPTEKSLLAQVNLPLAAVFQPFNVPAEGEVIPPRVDLGSVGPLRCQRCQGYANPGFRFIEGGRKFRCNLCGFVNDVPPEHFAQIDPRTGLRMEDISKRPEFYCGSVDYIATEEYCDQKPEPATFVFLIDVSSSAIYSGLVLSTLEAIKRCLPDIPGGHSARIGIIAFDRYLYFYHNKRGSGNISVLTVPDCYEPFSPLGNDFLVTLSEEGIESIHSTLSSISSQFVPNAAAQNVANGTQYGGNIGFGNRSSEAALAAAVIAAKDALKHFGGGKIVLISSSLSNSGIGKLESRGGGANSGGEEREKSLFRPAIPLYEKLGIELSEAKISLDLFVAPSGAYVDVATIGRLASNSGGRIFHFPFYQMNKDSKNFEHCFIESVNSVCAFNAVLRVRSSPGLGTAAHFGHFQPQRSLDIVIPVMDKSSTISVELEYDDKLPEVNDGSATGAPCIQCAVLYTDAEGRRRIRVHTLLVGSSSQLVNIFRYADCDAVTCHLAKKSAKMMLDEHVLKSKVREYIIERCVGCLYTYRKYCTVSASSGQLILPEALKLLPLFSLGLLKSIALSLSSGISPDERVVALFHMSHMGIAETVAYAYPRIFNLLSIPEAAGLALPMPHMVSVPKILSLNGNIETKEEPVALPPTAALSSEILSPDTLLLLENGVEMLFWIGENCATEALKTVFGLDHVPTVEDIFNFVSPTSKTADSKQIRYQAIFRRILRQRPFIEKIRVIRAKDHDETSFIDKLVEDRTSSSMSYVEYLCHIHREIQKKFNRALMLEEVQNYSMAHHF
eukprot:jgi/Galph1/3337/GphlegSOOS_G1955.1